MKEEGKDGDLLFRALHGGLDAGEERILAERLKAEPSLAAEFLRMARDEALLGEEVAESKARQIAVLAGRRKSRGWRIRPGESRTPLWGILAAAAALLVAGGLLAVLRPGRPRPRAGEVAAPAAVEEPRKPSTPGGIIPLPSPPEVPPPPIPLPGPPPAPPAPEKTAVAEAAPRPPERPAPETPPREVPAPLPPAGEEERPPTVPAESPAIFLARLTGPLRVQLAAGRAVPGRAGMVLRAGDALETGAGVRASIRFAGGNVVYCNTLTSLRLEERGVQLNQGEICCAVERGGEFRIVTPDGTMRVGGTRFLVKRAPILGKTVVTVAEGDVEVLGSSFPEPTRVSEGFCLTVTRGARRGNPERADPEALAMAWVNELRPVLLRENFEGYGARLDPPNWRDTGPQNSLVEDDSLFKVQPYGGTNAFGPVSPAVNIHSHYVGPGSSSWSAYRFSGRMIKNAPASQLGVTFFSRLPEGEDRYYRIRHLGTSDLERPFHVAPHPHHRPPPPLEGRTSSGLVPEVGVWYEFQLEVEARPSETAIRARLWRAGTARPREWAIDCVDRRPERLRGGTVGLWAMGGESLFDDLRVEAIDW